MNKLHISILFILFFSFISGCDNNALNVEERSTPTQTNTPVQIAATENQLNPYLQLNEFLQVEEWTKLTLVSEGGFYQAATIPIEDPKLIELLIQILKSVKEEIEGGSAHELHSVYFLLETGDKQYKVQVGTYGQVAFPDWFGTRVFGIQHNLVTIVDSLLKRPDYMPEAPFEERLWDGGLLYTQEGSVAGYMSAIYRTRLVADYFIPSDKEPVAVPVSHPGEEDFLVRLHSHGGTVEFLFYLDHNLVCVLDNDEEIWYQMSRDDIQQMRYIFVAD